MNAARAASWKRLALLGLAVLAAHVLLLRLPWSAPAQGVDAPMRHFVTRTVAPPAAKVPAAAVTVTAP